ncbi:hypothetical protein BJX64DRAFT_288217 [Aspergillus heterothallicus]
MAEIAATAAGLISLGIEACKLIFAYCDAWKGMHDDLIHAKAKAEGLFSTLQLASSFMGDVALNDPLFAIDIATKICQTAEWIEKVKYKADRLAIPQSTGARNGMRAIRKRLVYPFHKEDLQETVGALDSLQANLNTSILM